MSPRFTFASFWILTALGLAAGCGEDPMMMMMMDPPPVDGGEVTLANGVRVVIADETGAIELFDGDRPLWATPPGAYPTLRTFNERVRGSLAIYTFTRLGESESVYDRFSAWREEGGAAVVEYALTGDTEGTATLVIEPGERAGTTVIRLEATGVDAPSSFALPARCDADGSFHGFGEHYNSTEQTGEAFELILTEQGIGREEGPVRDVSGDSHTTYFPMPYYLDRRGFGVLARTNFRTHVDVCAAQADTMWFEVISGEPLELVVFHGPTTLDVISQLSEEVGRPAQPPEWAWGLWVSSQGGRDAVMADVAQLEAEMIPFSAIWSQDWTGVRMNIGGGFGVQYRWNADFEHYPELGAMIDDLHTRGYRFLAYANPFIDPDLDDHYPVMRDMGLLIESPDGGPYDFTAPNETSSHPDLTSEACRDYVRGELQEMVSELGIDGWMADFGEWTPLDAVLSSGEDPRAFHNRFPVEWHRVNREAMDAERSDGDFALFARSGWTGVQRHSMIHWIGDQEATWSETDGLPTVVPAMINLGLAGVPYVTHDIAGFSGGPSTPELYQRWTELGAFTPIMRTHEGNRRDVNHNWDTDAETIAHFRRFARVHDALRDDLVRWATEAQASSIPMVRHLMLEFPDDAEAWRVHDQYMLGDQLLVAPVVHEGETSRMVYFPAGATWYHVWTGDTYEGGSTMSVDAPIGSPPVFSRDMDRTDLREIE